jgi:hypothetical protein
MPSLDFPTAVDWLRRESGLTISASTGQVRLFDATQQELLMVESLQGGASVALWAPIGPGLSAQHAAQLGLHMLHWCADLDAMGSFRIARTPQTGQYVLACAPVEAADAASFVALCADAIAKAREIKEGLAEIAQELADEARSGDGPSSLAMAQLSV